MDCIYWLLSYIGEKWRWLTFIMENTREVITFKSYGKTIALNKLCVPLCAQHRDVSVYILYSIYCLLSTPSFHLTPPDPQPPIKKCSSRRQVIAYILILHSYAHCVWWIACPNVVCDISVSTCSHMLHVLTRVSYIFSSNFATLNKYKYISFSVE